jgi:drug/metabolite transporter (DMT)-like permease
MFIVIMFMGGVPQVTSNFFLFLFCASILDTIAFSCSYWAVKHTPISLLAPLGSFTPVFATFFGVLFLHEIPTPIKLLGIVTIVCGMYLLNIADIKGGILKPIQKLFSHPGVRLYFVQVILFGITPIFQKQAIFEIHPTMPLFAAFIGDLFVTIYLSVYGIKKVRQEIVSVL